MIDRISPSQRPNRIAAGFHQWRSLLFLHWPVPADALRSLIPNSLELDLYDDTAYIGLVPFAMQDVRPRWAPPFMGFRFLESNVRTYVTYRGQPGVYFLSLDAASRVGVWTARRFWGLPYFHARMSFLREADMLVYQSTRAASEVSSQIHCRIGKYLGTSKPESIEHFFLERYLFFLERGGCVHTGQVHHSPYPVHLAEVLEIQENLIEAAGCSLCDKRPTFAHYSLGVNVEIFRLQVQRRNYRESKLKNG